MEVIVPVFTPFKDDEKRTLKLDVIPKYVEWLMKNKVDYILVNGTTGEGPSLTLIERKQLTEAWVAVCKKHGIKIMVQIGGMNMTDVLDLAVHAEKLGVDSILCLPELYFKPKTVDEMVVYFERVCEVVPKTPVLLYHFPEMTKVHVDLMEFLIKMKHIKNFAGLKFTSECLAEGTKLANLDHDRFKFYLGCEDIVLGAFAQGVTGLIPMTMNVFPDKVWDILKSLVKGGMLEARKAQLDLNHVNHKIMEKGFWISTMKEVMSLITPINVGHPRMPVKTLTRDEIHELSEEITRLGIKLVH